MIFYIKFTFGHNWFLNPRPQKGSWVRIPNFFENPKPQVNQHSHHRIDFCKEKKRKKKT